MSSDAPSRTATATAARATAPARRAAAVRDVLDVDGVTVRLAAGTSCRTSTFPSAPASSPG